MLYGYLKNTESTVGHHINFDFKMFFSEVWHEKGGFDVVIGNPPYISYYGNKGQKLSDSVRNYFINEFNHVHKKNDRLNSMNLMTEKGLKLLNKNGFLTFITNKTLAVLPSYMAFREYLLKNSGINFLISNLSPFEAIVDCVIFGIQKKDLNTITRLYSGQLQKPNLVKKAKFLSNPKLELHQSEFEGILEKIEKYQEYLSDLITINRGVNIGGHFDDFLSSQPKEGYFKYLSGTKNVKPFFYKWEEKDGYFKFDQKKEQELRNKGATIVLGDPNRYLVPHLFIPESGQFLMAALAKERIYGAYGLLVGVSEKDQNLQYALALLNSELLTFYCLQRQILRKGNKATPHVGVKGLNSIPIPPNKNPSIIKSLNKYLTFIKHKQKGRSRISEFFHELINVLIYEYYFAEKVYETNKQISPYFKDIKPINEEMEDNYKFQVINAEFERLSENNHPVKQKMNTISQVEEVRIIKEALKG